MEATAPLVVIAAAVLIVVLTVATGSAQGMPPPSLHSGPAQAQGNGGDASAGRGVFQANCAMCHGADAAGMMGMHPSLRGAVERLSRQGVEVTIRKGRATQPPMPAFEGRLTDAEIADVVAYIASLPVGPRNFGPEGGGGGMMGRGMMGDRRRDWDPVVWATVLLVILAIAAALILALRRARPTAFGEDARSVLDHRYAAGELSREEYLERRRDLEA
jgi:mono/diheme cytochrome c family protein